MTTIKEQDELRDKILMGLEKTYERLIEFKKSKNSPLIVIKGGKIVELDPHEASSKTEKTDV